MALFKSYGEKVAEREAKEAAERAEREERGRLEAEKRKAATMEQLEELGLALDDYDIETLEDKTKENLMEIGYHLVYGNLSPLDLAAGKKPEFSSPESLLDLLVRQNFIIIQQNERIARLLEQTA